MKLFRCGDVIPGCDEEIMGSELEIFDLITRHASEVHGLDPIPDAVVAVIEDKITTIDR